MGKAPETYTVDAVSAEGKVSLAGVPQTWVDILPKGTIVAKGQELRGWLNSHPEYGPYFKIAADRAPQQSSNGTGKADEGIIWGWATNLAAQELAAGISHEQVVHRAQEIIAQRSGHATSPPEATPPEQGTQGVAAPALSDPHVKF